MFYKSTIPVFTLFVSVFSAGAPITGLLAFDPPTLSVNDALFNTQFKVKLLSIPTNPLQVSFEGPGFIFSNCSITLSDDKWQTMTVSGTPVFKTRAALTVAIKARVFVESGNVDQSYQAIRTIIPGGTCSSIADPHIQTFNNIAITTTDIGTYKLFEHKDLSIQTTQTAYGASGPASCNQAVAIRYGSSIVALDVRTSTALKQITANSDKLNITEPSANDAAYRITLPCGSIIKMTVNEYAGYKWIDVTLNIVSGYGSNGGICNKLNEQSGKLVSATGSLIAVADFALFAKSWVVADSENLLNGKYVLSNPGAITGIVCKIPKKSIVASTISSTTTNTPILQTYKPYIPTTTASQIIVVATTVIATTTVAKLTTTTQTSIVPVVIATTTVALKTTIVPTTITTTLLVPQTVLTTVTINNIIKTTTTVTQSTEIITSIVPTTTVIPEKLTTLLTVLSTNLVPVTVSTTSVVFLTSVLAITTTVAPNTTPIPIPSPPADFIAQATSHCKSLFDDKCKDILNQQHYIDACISDALLAGSLVFCESHKQSYNVQCKTQTDYMINDYQNSTVIIGEGIQKAVGLGDNKCLNDCSGKGFCGANGCRCNQGFGGSDCSNNLSVMISYNLDTGSYGMAGNANDGVVVVPSQVDPINTPDASVISTSAFSIPSETSSPIISGSFIRSYYAVAIVGPLVGLAIF